MSLPAILTIYAFLVVLASLVGGLAPVWLRLGHTRMQMALSLVGGAMLAVALLHLMPHAYYQLESMPQTSGWVLAGFLAMFLIERVFHFHHHGATEDDAHDHHDCQHAEHPHDIEHASNNLRWPAVLAGLSLHSVLDGIALAAAVFADEQGPLGLAGLSIFLIVLMHKPFDSLALGTLLASQRTPPAKLHVINLLYALTVPVGAILFAFGIEGRTANEAQALGIALAFAAGMFLCIATSDLLPELQFHTHDRFKLTLALLVGIAMAAGLVMLEETYHDHSHGHEHHQHDDHGHSHDHGHKH
ncbi:MAG: ZIP family metal transporter [Planctomycetes bacterium]|nr:ZIP family metal transporter [Planctomycetota bacterium]